MKKRKNKIVVFLLFFLASSISVIAEGDNSPIQPFKSQYIPTYFYKTLDTALHTEIISDTGISRDFQPIQSGIDFENGYTYWYLLDFDSTAIFSVEKCFLGFYLVDQLTLFFQNKDSIHQMTGGLLAELPAENNQKRGLFPINADLLIKGRYLLAKINHYYWKRPMYQPILMSEAFAEIQQTYLPLNYLKAYIPGYLFLGGMLLMIFFTLGLFLINRDFTFLYYLLFMSFLSLYLFVRLQPWGSWLEINYPLPFIFFNELIQVLVNISYLVFISFFLQTDKDYPLYHQSIKMIIALLGVIMVFQLIFLLNANTAWIEQYLVQSERIFMIIYSIASYFYLWKVRKDKKVLFVIAGSSSFLLGGILAMLLGNIRYMMIGALVEIFVFSLAMGYRIKVVQNVEEKLEAEMDKIRLKALRAQMNPHFIFNSLNSVRAYIISNEQEKASAYLKKFARLIRLILQYSERDTINLSEEVEALKLYVELEEMRFQTSFGFSIIPDEDLPIQKLRIPPMILQPFVENAIVHGLSSLATEKKLSITLSATDYFLLAEITDNGVGREIAGYKKKIYAPQHQSMATELTKKRIALLFKNKQYLKNIEVIDLVENNKPKGTTVKLQLPLMRE